MYRAVQTILAVAALLPSGALVPATPAAAQAQVLAGGQQCISTEIVRIVNGVYDSSYVQYVNRCGSAVGFFWCQSSVYQQSNPPACNAMTGTYNFTTAPVGWQQRVSTTARVQTVIAIRECPTGYRPYAKRDGKFYCTR
ncbi:hypothetical protein [Sphingomonas sp. 1P08PE]|uniref:hypothetical protein n=1 Tax=Sphingomonas sp. 1P08PE TaxID=554122 RepID=UPI0039A04237